VSERKPRVRVRQQIDLGAQPDSKGKPTKGRAHQEFKDDADINQIMERFRVTGILKKRTEQPMYGDFSGLTSFEDAMAITERAKEMFQALPVKVRNRFANDPAQMIEFVDDPANQEEAVWLGMCAPEPDQRPQDPRQPFVSDQLTTENAEENQDTTPESGDSVS